jgi:hypothetical protein
MIDLHARTAARHQGHLSLEDTIAKARAVGHLGALLGGMELGSFLVFLLGRSYRRFFLVDPSAERITILPGGINPNR